MTAVHVTCYNIWCFREAAETTPQTPPPQLTLSLLPAVSEGGRVVPEVLVVMAAAAAGVVVGMAGFPVELLDCRES